MFQIYLNIKKPINLEHSVTCSKQTIRTVVTDLSLKAKEGLLCKGKKERRKRDLRRLILMGVFTLVMSLKGLKGLNEIRLEDWQ